MTSVPIPRLSASAIFAFAFVILLALSIREIAGFDALGGMPLGLAGLLMVLVRDAPEVTRLPENSRRTAIGWAVVSCPIFVLAVWVDSTALRWIALGLFGAGWLAQLFRWPRLGGLLVLIALIALPVTLLQQTLLQSLQQLASVMASWALDAARVAHLRQGVVLETINGALFVEEACSGMQSLLSGLVAAQVYFCWQRKGLLFSLAGLGLCTAFLVLGNSLRIFFIAWMYADHAIDLTRGWQHEATGMAVYLLVLVLLPSLVCLLEECAAAYARWRGPRQVGPRWLSEGEEPDLRPWVALKIMAARFSNPLRIAVSLMALAVVAEALVFQENGPVGAGIRGNDLPQLAAIQLPAQLAGWQKDPAGSEVSVIEKMTLDQHIWTFHKGGLTAWVAADLPYDDLHPLRLCYLNRDWAITREGPVSAARMPFSFLELRSTEKTRPPMIVCYDNFDLSGNRYVGGPPSRLAGRRDLLLARLKGKSSIYEATGKGPYCQVQVVVAGVTDHESAEGVASIELLTAAREFLAPKLSSASLHLIQP